VEESWPVSAGTSSGPSRIGAAGGECGALVRAHDWSTTTLGPVERWPAPLRMAASICLESRYGMCVFWGPQFVAIYNDAYVPMLGVKHPGALGTPLRDIWPEIWDLLEPMLEGVVQTGEPTWHEDQPLLLDRNGFVEEAYFTYSFSPIRDEAGAIGGVFTAVHEATSHVLGTRRLQALAALGEGLAAAQTEGEVVAAAIDALARAPQDVTFAALYLIGDGAARFAGACRTDDRWLDAAATAVDGEQVLDAGAVVLPVAGPGSEAPAAALVLGASPRHHLDENYRDFFRMIARQLSDALSSAADMRATLEVTRLRDALASGELERAREMEEVALTLQRSMLPRALPDVLGAELSGRYVPASESLEIGGDFYDATALGDGRLVITIGDVAGHGVFAAAVMGQVRQAVRAYAFEGHPPAALMDRLDLLVSDSDLAMTTCLCGILDPSTGLLRFANAGHPPPLVRRADGTVERVTEGLSHPVGVTMAHRHVEAELTLGMGEALLLYTDGLVERRGEIIDAGIDRLAARLAAGFTSAGDACERIVSDLEDNLSDDAALLFVARTPMAGERLHTVVQAHPNRLAELRRRLAAWLTAHGASREERNDIVLAAHEAAMNAIEHAYGPGDAEITVSAVVREGAVEVSIHDAGQWREPRSEHRGRGRSIMSALMDDVSIESGPTGSTVRLRRRLHDAGDE
jgi:serine phosphatase RsbU (regulator of sigma subunit)/anti-sigma regulatory factor (Ser/Thr protein kinase)